MVTESLWTSRPTQKFGFAMDDMGWSPVPCGSKPQVALAFLSNGDANPRRPQEASPSIVSIRN
jgi:hypothetical protein